MKALIWSKEACGFCESAKTLLQQKGYEVEERKIGNGWTKEQLLESVPTAKSVPQIFIDGEYIGGYDKLKSKIS